MNREERRKRMREYAKNDMAEKCPLCNKKSLFIAVPTKEWLCDVRCELCKGIVLKDCKDLIPMTCISPTTYISVLTERGNK